MKFTSIAAAALLSVASLAQAGTQIANVGNATLSYDDSTGFGYLHSWTIYGPTSYGFDFVVPDAAGVQSTGALQTVTVQLPTFTLTADAGYTLSGSFTGFLGNLAYTEIGGATTGILAYADVSVNGGPAMSLSGLVGWTMQQSGPGYNLGYFADSASTPDLGSFHSITISNASIVLSATGGVFSSIQANSQNRLGFSFNTAVAAVPEPETYAMLLAGLGVVGLLARRRKQA